MKSHPPRENSPAPESYILPTRTRPNRVSVSSIVILVASLGGCGSVAETHDGASPPVDGSIDTVIAIDSSIDASDTVDSSVALDTGSDLDAVTAIDARTDVGAPDTRPTPPTSALLLNGTAPMSCADPAVFSANDADAVFYVYCTGMSHVWRTSDWASFTDTRSSTRFDLTGMSANGQQIGSWWAPGIVYAPDLNRYVMWVSVPAAAAVRGTSGWDTRALAVLIAASPTGPWVFSGIAQSASSGEHFIDPFLFRDHDGRRYVYWKQYGGGLGSLIRGAAVDATWRNIVAGSQVDIMDGFGGPGTWELNVRENPALYYDSTANRHHLIFSGGHWAEDNYATGHALSACGPLCVNTSNGGWHMVSSGDRGIEQVVRSNGDPNFSSGGPGGAVFQDHAAHYIVYAAAARSAHGDTARYLMRDRVQWSNAAPYVDTAGHHPLGL